ncbi:membrane protein insertase YidC [Qipengyuania atrilutea]|uniref:Membrane protein insertase YidC n=1 Tax=Qipengyuania atrilutea TaxID=2744473 RepID=A0A850H2E8_9SPHN|nr:membrane protein insertase YidC [Actirhodobacter atriluteus]NVD44856.1 membrane protein insertase YidC [Actirhodobacter atriluteus]
MDNQRNLLLAVLLSAVLLFGWDAGMRFLYPDTEGVTASEREDAPTQRASGSIREGEGAAIDVPRGEIGTQSTGARGPVSLDSALGAGGRIDIASPLVSGSVNPIGAQIDDITLNDYRQSVDRDSGPIRIFAPEGTDAQQYARFGFLENGQVATPEDAVWQTSGGTLAPGNPITLTRQGSGGLTYTVRLSIDERYMITAEQSVANRGGSAAVVQPFALVARTSETASADIWNAHSGPIGGFAGTVNYEPDYDELDEAGTISPAGAPDWIGFTDIYWLSALIPDPDAAPEATFRSLGGDTYRADLIYAPLTVAPGQEITRTTRLFAGAKDSSILDAYQDAGVTNFGLAIDWGWFRWFEKPILWLLLQFNALTGNFGVAIILLTVMIRLILFPIAQKQFASMAAMKAIQPKMKAVQERHKDDKQKQQQEIMKLYKEEKVNPLAGCLPILIQIPIFFALYKVLILAIEMRHEPFILWIRDLSAPDPAYILNLFGLLPFTPPSFLGIGVLAVLLGITMWLTFKLNPAAMDPVQQQIFNIMPWVLMFVMAPFAAGLLLYWVTNNLLTLAQQSYLYSKNPQLRAAAEKERAEKAKAAAAANDG